MSKLGVHVSAGNRRGFGEFLQACSDAGNPVPVIFSVDQDVWPDVQAKSPTTLVVFRAQVNGQDGPPNIYQGDPVASAQTFMSQLLPKWRQNPATYYAPLNEQDPPTLAAFAWLNVFTLECLRIAEANGFKLALYAFSAGNPKHLLDPVTQAVIATPEQCWLELVPSLKAAKRGGHVLILHEYGFDSPATADAPATTLRASESHGLALRYRKSYQFLNTLDACPPLIVGECSAATGAQPAWSTLTRQQWLDDAKWYDARLMEDAAVLGCCLYQVGGDESFVDYLAQVGAYIGATPTADPLAYPVVGCEVIDPPPAGEYVTVAEFDAYVASQAEIIEDLTAQLTDIVSRLEALESGVVEPPPAPVPGIGVDVSHWQGVIDWPAVRASGQSFAFIKCTEGSTFTDDRFAINWVQAKAAGLLRGAYHFYRFGVDPLAQARNFVETLGTDRGDLPAVVDVEDTATPANAAQLKTFIDAVWTATGRRPIVYTAAWWWNAARFGGTLPDWAGDFDLWVAHYTSAAQPTLPASWRTWRFWQHSNVGHVAGIAGDVDLNRFNGTVTDLVEYAETVVLPPPPPVVETTCLRAVGVGNPQLMTTRETDAIRVSLVEAVKLLTLADPGQMAATIDTVRRALPNAFLLARLFYKADPEQKHRFDPAEFVATVTPGLSAAYAAGVRYFEIHNEPNWPGEGYGWNWAGGAEFGAWLLGVLGLLRAKYPLAKWGYPGLSPQPNTLPFLDASRSAVLACDWLGAHSYWSRAKPEWSMTSLDGGMYWKRLRALFPDKPLIVTEFSNNDAGVGYDVKGAEYAQYFSLLRHEKNLLAACAFALSWPGQDTRREGWVVNNVITQTPIALGAATRGKS